MSKIEQTKETKPLVAHDEEPMPALSDEQLETVTAGLLPQIAIIAILIGM